MEMDKHSLTAVMMAAVRAYHYSVPQPRIFEDAIARALVSPAENELFERNSVQMLRLLNPELAAACRDRASLLDHALRAGPGVGPLVRARYIEEVLSTAVTDGVRQYVIIGAGLDTFAFRRPDLSPRLRVIEIDHPASQAFKRERLAEAGLVPPQNLYFAAADLERENVADALARTPYDSSVATFFAWPGVTMYLTRKATFETLRSIASIAGPGSRLVFDYIEPGAYGPNAPPRLRIVVERAQQFGEPMVPNLTAETMKSDLASTGFQMVEDLGPIDIQARFLEETDGFKAVEYWHLVQSVVADSSPGQRRS